MNKIKVYLKRPWIFADSPYYDYLTKGVSSKIDYVNIKNKPQGIIQNLEGFKMLNKTKRAVKLTLRNLFPWLPNAHLAPKKDYDLIHCAHSLSLNKKPWVCDIEYVNQFWAGGIPRKQRLLILKLLESKHCKKILAWTEWTKRGILEKFPEIGHKVEIVYPAIESHKSRRTKDKKIRLLFVSRRFYFKGGLHALGVMDRLTKRHKNVEATIISEVPKEIIKIYSKNTKIKFFDFIPKEKLFSKIYPQTDILIYPSYTDTFGFIILEALSFGIPVVTVDGQSRSDIVRNGINGFVVKEPERFNLQYLENLNSLKNTIEELERKTESLIKNNSLREKMSKSSLKEFKNGRFSVRVRNKKLERIYSEAINDLPIKHDNPFK